MKWKTLRCAAHGKPATASAAFCLTRDSLMCVLKLNLCHCSLPPTRISFNFLKIFRKKIIIISFIQCAGHVTILLRSKDANLKIPKKKN